MIKDDKIESTNQTHLMVLIEQFRALEIRGAALPSYAQRSRRSEVLDELQDAVGLSGKMVTENDILKRAEQILGGSGDH